METDTVLAPVFRYYSTINHIVQGTGPAQAQTVRVPCLRDKGVTTGRCLGDIFLLSKGLHPPLTLRSMQSHCSGLAIRPTDWVDLTQPHTQSETIPWVTSETLFLSSSWGGSPAHWAPPTWGSKEMRCCHGYWNRLWDPHTQVWPLTSPFMLHHFPIISNANSSSLQGLSWSGHGNNTNQRIARRMEQANLIRYSR